MFILFWACFRFVYTHGFLCHPSGGSNNHRVVVVGLPAEKNGYEFGDISRSLAQQAATRIKGLTGKETYQFGDLTRWLDQQAKQKVANFTKAQDGESYQFGDITRETLRRVHSGEYETKDLFLALRLLLSAGASLSPIASVLPIKWLLDLLNFGLAQDVGGRLVEVLALNLDKRMKLALIGDSNYRIGDWTKKRLEQAIADFTGKENGEYEFGDITRKLMSTRASRDEASRSSRTAKSTALMVNDDVLKELEDWDRRLETELND